jgi:hypothetical protein
MKMIIALPETGRLRIAIEKLLKGSSGIAVVVTLIWGCERAAAPSHPQIGHSPTENPNESAEITRPQDLFMLK